MSAPGSRVDAAAYVLDAVGTDERTSFEQRMAREPGVAREVADLARVAALLALAAPAADPPGDLRGRILARTR